MPCSCLAYAAALLLQQMGRKPITGLDKLFKYCSRPSTAVVTLPAQVNVSRSAQQPQAATSRKPRAEPSRAQRARAEPRAAATSDAEQHAEPQAESRGAHWWIPTAQQRRSCSMPPQHAAAAAEQMHTHTEHLTGKHSPRDVGGYCARSAGSAGCAACSIVCVSAS